MNRSLKRNLRTVYILYALNYAFPVVSLAYLSRVLGPYELGRYAFAESCSRSLQILIEFGFSVTATREIATHRQQPRRMGYILSSVAFTQLLLAAAGALAFAVLVWVAAPFRSAAHLLPGALLSAAGMGMIPYWYFQALENLPAISTSLVIARTAALGAMLLAVHGPGDNWRVLVIQGLSATACTLWGYRLICRDLRLERLRWRMVPERLKAGGFLFLGRLAVLLSSTLNPVIASMVASPKQVAYLSLSERISRGLAGTMHPLNQVIYPRIVQMETCSRPLAASFVCKYAIAAVFYSLILGVGLFIGAPWIIGAMAGAEYQHSVLPLRILALLPVCICLNNILGLQWMTALRMDRALLWVTAGAALSNLALFPLLGRHFGAPGMCAAVVLVEALSAAGAALVLFSRKMDPIRLHGLLTPAGPFRLEAQR